MARSSQFTKTHYVWKEGMSGWELAENIAELACVLGVIPLPAPTI